MFECRRNLVASLEFTTNDDHLFRSFDSKTNEIASNVQQCYHHLVCTFADYDLSRNFSRKYKHFNFLRVMNANLHDDSMSPIVL